MAIVGEGKSRYDVTEIDAARVPAQTRKGTWTAMAADALLRLEATPKDKALAFTMVDEATSKAALSSLYKIFRRERGVGAVSVRRLGCRLYVQRGPKWQKADS